MGTSDTIDVFLFDIEGTTTSISFVYDILFPYARREVESFLGRNWDEPAVREVVDAFRQLAAEDARAGLSVTPIAGADAAADVVRDAVVASVHQQMDVDRKSTPLKALQGLIWRAGYETGELRGHLFADVAPAFARLKEQGRRVCIYSSGSIAAQRLLFGHSVAGDLQPCIDGCFDTTIGPKKDPESYRRIAETLGVEPERVRFFSDNVDELAAAHAAGMQVRLAVRPGNPVMARETRFERVSDFALLPD